MGIEFVDLETAKQADGLRIVLLKGVPSPWSQAAKAFLELKEIDALAVWMQASDPEISAWTGVPNAPVALYGAEPPRSGWADILALAERLAPEPALLPRELEQRMRVFGYANELMGQGGLVWQVRLLGVDAALSGTSDRAYPEAVAHYLGARYGYVKDCGQQARARAVSILAALAAQLARGREAGGPYYFGPALTALDVYSATVMDSLAPLPAEQCPMHPKLRAGLEGRLEELGGPWTSLLEHRDMMHERHLPLPIVMG